MKNSIRLVKIAQKDAYNDMLDSLSQKSKDRKNEAMSNSNDKAQRYNFLKQKAEGMGISVADYVNHFGSFDDKKNFSNLANQQSASQKPVPEDNSIQGYEKVLNAFQFIKEKSEELNIPIIRIWEDIQLPSEIKRQVLTLVVNYQRLQEANQERKVQNNVSQSESLEDRLKKATENARFYSEQWNQAIDDAKNQNIDPIVYISAHYPDDLAQQIIAWYKIKTGEIDATNMEEYFAQSVEQVSNQEVESFNENYDDDTFQNFVDKAREFAENIDWEKAGAYLDEGKNRVIYQLLKPGSFIKKTSDSIKVIISMLTLKNVEKFNNEYYENQNNTQRAEQELDDYLRTSKMNTRQVIASLNKVANELDNSGMFNEATELTNVMHKVAQMAAAPVGGAMQMAANPNANLTALTGVGLTPRQLLQAQQQVKQQQQQQVQQQKQQRGMSAQQWINANSNLVGGDVNKLIQSANQALQMGGMGKDIHNDIMYILNLRRPTGLGAVRQQDANKQPGPTMGLA
jgi:hypothetical protein